MKLINASIIIPVHNPNENFKKLLYSLKNQEVKCKNILFIHSRSNDVLTISEMEEHWEIIEIKEALFDHGGTRQMAVDLYPEVDYIIFLTQDVILVNNYSIKNIIKVFSDKTIGCAYGRQIPHVNANLLSQHARFFNYPPDSKIKSLKDVEMLGIKTPFISNSFAVYRRKALTEIGGFPANIILGEDIFVAAKMLLEDWKIAYVAEAQVYHSHNYTICQEFKRYFDIGVFHSKESWIRERFGKAENEGKCFIESEFSYIKSRNLMLIIPMILRNIMKFIGYRLGFHEKIIPLYLKKSLSMNRKYWKRV